MLDRPNLHLQTDSRVLRLAMDGTALRVWPSNATMARWRRSAREILCAGAFDSPRLLLLSGIGPVSQLERLGIAPVADLPVGENLIDHLLIGVVYDCCSRSPTATPTPPRMRSPRSTPDRADCDIQISFAKEPHFAPETNDGVPRFTIIPGITRPKSRGTVCSDRRRSRCPTRDRPVLLQPPRRHAGHDPGRSAQPGDRGAGGSPLERRGTFPGPEVCDDDEIAAYVARDVSTWFHRRHVPHGRRSGRSGRSALRVHGITGLRLRRSCPTSSP